MLQVTREIITDVTLRSTGKAVIAKQNDTGSRFLNVHIQESGKTVNITSPSTVIFNVLRPDGSSGEFYGSVNENGTVRVGLTSWMLGQPGIVSCDISIVNESSKLTTMTFYIEVEPAVVTDGAIEEAEEYNVIVDLLTRTAQAEEQASNAAAQAEHLRKECEDATEKANEAADTLNLSAEKISRGGFVESLKEINNGDKFNMWVGTQEEYDVEQHSIPGNTLCIITDDPTAEEMGNFIEEVQFAHFNADEGTELVIDKVGYSVTPDPSGFVAFVAILPNGFPICFNDVYEIESQQGGVEASTVVGLKSYSIGFAYVQGGMAFQLKDNNGNDVEFKKILGFTDAVHGDGSVG